MRRVIVELQLSESIGTEPHSDTLIFSEEKVYFKEKVLIFGIVGIFN